MSKGRARKIESYEEFRRRAEAVRREIEELRKQIVKKWPLLDVLVSNIVIVIVSFRHREVDRPLLAGDVEIYINVDYWEKLDRKYRLAVLLHELFHVLFKHNAKCRQKSFPEIFNIAADAVVNNILEEMKVEIPQGFITPDSFDDWDLRTIAKRGSADELYYAMLRLLDEEQLQKYVATYHMCDLAAVAGVESESDVWAIRVSAGGGRKIDDLFNYMKTLAACVGVVPAWFKLVIEIGEKSFVDWRRILRAELQGLIQEVVYSTWLRPNRKCPGTYPGYVWRGKAKPRSVWVLVDVSGSVVVDRKTLVQFFTELLEIVKVARVPVYVVPWDVEVKGCYLVKTVDDVHTLARTKIRGGGGTKVDAALKYFLKHAPPQTVCILMSDGIWGPAEKELFDQVRKKALKAIYVYTVDENIELTREWVRIRLV